MCGWRCAAQLSISALVNRKSKIVNPMPPRLWQRQPDEAPADFTAFATYLRLKGRRTHRAAATQTGRSLGAIRRLSAQFNWRARATAFEARLANASQDALDLLVRATTTRTTADYVRFREAEFQLAQQVLKDSQRWLKLAGDPRRRDVSLAQICRLMELSSKLGRLATGLPTGDEPRRRRTREEKLGYWNGPSMEEALAKIYGSPEPAPAGAPASDRSAPSPPDAPVPAGPCAPPQTRLAPRPPEGRAQAGTPSPSTSGDSPPVPANLPPPIAEAPRDTSPGNRRRDAWSSLARAQRRSPA
jgi:hypothetical protein